MLRPLLVLTLATLGCEAGSSSPAGTKTFYLNRAGATLRAGADDAAQNRSSVVRGDTVIPAAQLDDAAWAGVVDCLRTQFSPFDVRIVGERPADPSYLMALFGGTGDELGVASDVMGRAPIDMEQCRTVERAVVIVFSSKIGPNVQRICEVAAHEIAHTFSVDHEYLSSEPTSYLPHSGGKTFQDVDAACGESAERPCICGRASQNSVRLLTERIGKSAAAAADVTPPSAEIDWTASRGGLAVRVRAADALGVARVVLSYRDASRDFTSVCGDGLLPCNVAGDEFRFMLPVPDGEASFHATVVDRAGNRATTDERQVVFAD